MKKLSALEPILFYAFLALLLIPVWSVDFFVTGDGPCHLHNSKILLDWFNEQNKQFYDPFYYLNTVFNPNLLYNMITVPLLWIFKAGLTEKIYFTVFILGFGLGFRYLVGGINTNAKYLGSVGLLFCYHNLLMKGFFNNSLSFALLFWVTGWWYRKRDDASVPTLLCNAALILLLYFSHPMGLVFTMMLIGSLMIGLLVYEGRNNNWKDAVKIFFTRIKIVLISGLPAFILFIQYFMGSNMSPDTSAHSFKGTLDFIFHLYAITILTATEDIFSLVTSITCIVLFLLAIFIRIRKKQMQPTDGLFGYAILVFLCIFFPPSSIAGGLEISYRMAMMPFFAFLFFAATADFPVWFKIAIQSLALCIGIGFILIRLPLHQKASDYAKEIDTCDPYINNHSTVFVLNYDWEGHTPDGKLIADRAGLFSHVDCYLGTNKSLIISDNYEAHFSYFPVISRWNTNMYTQTDKDGINFDNRPPRADILNYNKRTGENIDYVLMLSYKDEFKDHPFTQEIIAQLEQGYDKVYTSQHERAILYKRKGL
ncbi:MAG: hypothetical protein WBP41_02055 [Saprospiraceae bacterium]